MTGQRHPNPYCGFKSDHERRLALRSRDVRLVLIAVVGVAGAALGTPHAQRVWAWALGLLHLGGP